MSKINLFYYFNAKLNKIETIEIKKRESFIFIADVKK
jgi:hypothetical protein